MDDNPKEPTEQGKKAAAIYIRVSRDEEARGVKNKDQVEEKVKLSWSTQETDAREFCKSNNWKDIKVYKEERAISGLTDNRPEYQMMLRHIAEGKIHVVIARELSRLTRNPSDCEALTEHLKMYGVKLVLNYQLVDYDSEEGEFILGIKSVINKFYAKQSTRLQQIGILAKLKTGTHNQGKGGTYGYDVDEVTDKPVINEPQAKVVRRIFKMLVEGKSLTAIAGQLNREKLKPFKGKMFRNSSLKVILGNKRYIGKLDYKSRLVGKVEEYDCEFPRIVSNKLFNDAQKRLKEVKGKQTKGFFSDNMLVRVLNCPYCIFEGRTPSFCYQPYKRESGNWDYYKCSGKTAAYPLEERCKKSVNINAKSIEPFILEFARDYVLSLMSNKPEKYEIWFEQLDSPDVEEKINSVKGEIRQLGKRMEEIRGRLITAIDFPNQLDLLTQTYADAKKRKGHLEKDLRDLETEAVVRVDNGFVQALEKIAANEWDSLKREQIRELLEKILVAYMFDSFLLIQIRVPLAEEYWQAPVIFPFMIVPSGRKSSGGKHVRGSRGVMPTDHPDYADTVFRIMAENTDIGKVIDPAYFLGNFKDWNDYKDYVLAVKTCPSIRRATPE